MTNRDRYKMDLFVQNMYKNNKPKLDFDPNMTTSEFMIWKSNVIHKAKELMQYPDNMFDNPVVNHITTKHRDRYRIEKYEIQPEPDLWIPFLVLIPDNACKENKAPAVMCCPGSATPKETLCGEDFSDFSYQPATDTWKYPYANAQALHFVKKGMVAVASDNPGTGEQEGTYNRNQLSLKMIMKGRNYVGLTVMYRQAILNWIKKQEYVDRNKIGLTGHSLGTESTMFLSLFDDDIKAVVHNDFVASNYQRIISCYPPDNFIYGAFWHMVPNMHEWLSFVELLAACAPKKLLVSEGGVTSDLLKIVKAYEIAGSSNNFKYVYYPEFQEEKNRLYDNSDIPENLSMDEYFKYSNVNPKKHFFKFETAVPWLVEALK